MTNLLTSHYNALGLRESRDATHTTRGSLRPVRCGGCLVQKEGRRTRKKCPPPILFGSRSGWLKRAAVLRLRTTTLVYAMVASRQGSHVCDECRRFHSHRGILVRAFECDLAVEWMGWNVELGNHFVSPRDGSRLISSPSHDELTRFQGCGLRELALRPRDEKVSGRGHTRATTQMRDDVSDPEHPTFASNFGLTLSSRTLTQGAYAFDAWTTGNRPFCKNESSLADLRLHFVDQFCAEVAASSSPRWALERRIGRSEANCRFKSVPAMLEQQSRYRAMLRRSKKILERCPYALHAGAINQVSAVYNGSDITGVFVLDWEPSHPRLAALAYSPLMQTLRWRQPDGDVFHVVHFARASADRLNCTCHRLPLHGAGAPFHSRGGAGTATGGAGDSD